MANETSTTSLAVNVPTELIEAEIIDYLYAQVIVAPLVQKGFLGDGKGVVWQQTKFPAITASAPGETTDTTPATRTTTLEANVTVAEVTAGTKITDLAQSTTVGGAGDPGVWAKQHGIAHGEKIDSDICALFSGLNASSAVGATGVDISVANFITAIYTLENANVPMPYTCVLHPRQKLDLFSALASTSNAGALHTNLPELIRAGSLAGGTPANGFWGTFCGVPIYISSKVATANSAADRAGAMFGDQALVLVQHKPLTIEYDRDASARITEVISTIVYGVGENDEHRGVPIITDAD